MTSAPTASSTVDSGSAGRPERPAAARVAPLLAAGALVAGPLLWAGGILTAPPQASEADADYIASLARDLRMTEISALLLHYGNIAIGVGVLAAPALVRGAKGAWLALVGAVLTMIGFVNVSGMILADWWNASTGRQLTSEQAVAVFQGVKQSPLLFLWDGTMVFSLLGPILLFAGLARAGVVGWWTVPVFVAGAVGLMVLGAYSTVVTSALVLVGFAPFAIVGLRLVQRSRLARA